MSLRLALTSALRTAARSNARRSAFQLAQKATAGSMSSRLFSTSQIPKNIYRTRVLESVQSELEHENNQREEFPVEYNDLLKKTGFEVRSVEGESLGKLVKEDEYEAIHVLFDINQVVNIRPEEFEGAEEENLENDEGYDPQFDGNFINLSVIIERKSDKTALTFDVMVGPDEGSCYIENVAPFRDSAIALSQTPETEQKRELQYNGPAFSDLDEELQTVLENYLKSRGVNFELYQFIFNYGIYKENVEYIKYLNRLQDFFEVSK